MAQPSDACIISKYNVHDTIADVNRHLAKADGSGEDEAQKAWISELSRLVRILEDRFQVLTTFGESDFHPREVNEIHATFVDVVLYARMQSFASLHLPDPSQEEVDAAMTRLALGQDFFTALERRAAQPALIHNPGCEACQEAEVDCIFGTSERGTCARCQARRCRCTYAKQRSKSQATSANTGGSPGPQMKRSRGKKAASSGARSHVAESSSAAGTAPIITRGPYVDATALLNKLRGTPAPAGGADDLIVHVNGFKTALYFIRERQGWVAVDVITVVNALRQAGVMILTLGVEEHDSDVDSVPGGEAEDDDGDAEV
ncbi:hypothetical protein BKA93DRAFT_824700 [Sparassis latifolia]